MDLPAMLLIGVAAVIGGAVQSLLGFGAAFMLVPAIAAVAPELLPGAPITAFFPLAAVMVVREHHHIDRPAVRRLVGGRIPGTLLGTLAVTVLPTRGLAACVAVLLGIAVTSTAMGWTIPDTPRNEGLAGVVSGFAGTAVGLGGPPLALLYRNRVSTQIRPTLAVVFTLGTLLSIATLGATDNYHRGDLVAGSVLAALTVLGLVGAAPLLRRLPEARIRQGLLVWAGVGAVLALVRVLLG